MNFRLWKALKRRLRKKSRPGWSWAHPLRLLALLLTGLLGAHTGFAIEATFALEAIPQRITSDEVARLQGPLFVEQRRDSLCGSQTLLQGEMEPQGLAFWMKAHPDWQAVHTDSTSILLVQEVDELVGCQSDAFIGVNEQGEISLYDGPPEEEKEVRTFYQLDVQYMESRLPAESLDALSRGIPVKDRQELNSVLSTYSEFAFERTSEKAMGAPVTELNSRE